MLNIGFKGQQSKPKTRVGLDIGTHSIKILELKEDRERFHLAAIGMKKLLGGSKEASKDAIKALAEESKISARTLNISISGPSVIVRFISMPDMMEDELKSAIRFEAEKFIPFSINDYIVDFQILNKTGQDKKLNILLAAAKKADVEERLNLVKSCGFSAALVDVDSFALTNSFLKNFPNIDQDKTFAILNIGSSLTNLSIIKGSALCLARDIAIAGNDMNAFLSKGLGVGIDAVEEIKHSPGERADEVINYSKGILNNLLDELRLSCSYYENQCGRSVDEIYVCGGSAHLAGLDEMFEEILGSKPIHWDPLQFLERSSANTDLNRFDKVKSVFAVAVGLALR